MTLDTDQCPARPQRLNATFQRSGEQLLLRCRSREWGGGVFMLLWLIGWTVGCVFLAGMVIRDPKLFHFLFAIPFWTSWIFVFCMLLKSFFQREELLLDREGVVYVEKIFVPRQRRKVPLDEIRSLDQYMAVVDSESGRCQSGIEIRTLGRPIRLAQGLSQPELDWLRFQLNDHLQQLQAARGQRREQPQEESAQVRPSENRSAIVLSPAKERVTPPSDCGWKRFDDFDEFGFVRRGRLSLGSLFGVAFVTLFWNGIVSVFVAVLWGLAPGEPQLQGIEWWGLFVFLIPFEVIGLVMLLAFLSTLLEPVHRTRWTFTRRGIEQRHTWLGLGPRWTWEVDSLDRLELRPDDSSDRRRFCSVNQVSACTSMGAEHYRLSLVDQNNRELCSIPSLTEGEARWIGDTLLKERGIWFR